MSDSKQIAVDSKFDFEPNPAVEIKFIVEKQQELLALNQSLSASKKRIANYTQERERMRKGVSGGCAPMLMDEHRVSGQLAYMMAILSNIHFTSKATCEVEELEMRIQELNG